MGLLISKIDKQVTNRMFLKVLVLFHLLGFILCQIWSSGYNQYGSLGLNHSLTPITTPERNLVLENAIQITEYQTSILFLTKNGDVYASGQGNVSLKLF